MKTDYYIYILFRETGVPFYVGKGRRNRWCHDKRVVPGRSHRDNVIHDMHRRGYELPKVKVAEGLTNDEAKVREIAFIAAIGREPHGPLINQTRGGDGCVDLPLEILQIIGKKVSEKMRGRKVSEQTRQKMRIAQKARSPEYLKAAQEANRGLKRSPETRAKQRAAKLGKPLTESHKKKIGDATRGRVGCGYVMTDEIREKMRQAKLGRKLPATHKDRIGAALRGRKLTEEHKQKLRNPKSKRRVKT